ncbi:unnamed protein product [Heterobilharzia americana]|nr:unnamed protein product [Heterobilharzia americana]
MNKKNNQIWPLVDADSEDESFWDDNDLIAEYNKIDSIVKDKLAEELVKQEGIKSSKGRNNIHGNSRKQSFSTRNKQKITLTEDTKDGSKEDMVNSGSLDGNPVCNLQWIPPCTNPPIQLFSQSVDSSESNLFSPIQLDISSQGIFKANRGDFSNIIPLLHTWYEAGYQLGRSHALKFKMKSYTPVVSNS